MAELLKQVQYLKDNGFTEQQANTLIYFHKDRVENDLASKKDILLLQKDIEGVRKDIEQLRSETKKDIEALRSETKKDIEGVRKDIEQLRSETKKDIEGARKDIIIKLGSVMVVGISVLAVLMRLLD